LNVVGRARRRQRMARAQAAGLRLPFLLAPIHRRSPLLLRRRLRELEAHDIGAFIRELDDDGIHARTEAAIAEYCALAPQFAPGPGSVDPLEGALLYGLVRALRPATVIETGTASGISTTYLLAALHRNGAGRLASIDLPFEAGLGLEVLPIIPGTAIDLYDSSPVPQGKESGWAVPDELRGRWELRLGDSRKLLPEALKEVGEIQIFFHDSLHTRDHMLFEFEAVWPHLAPGGVLVADDIFQRKHDAFPAFAREVGRSFSTFGNLGLIRK
jgi:predicted O-methyltransferase YrrM